MRLTGRIRPGDERGAVLLVMAVAIPVFLLIIAMAIDFGSWYAHKRQLQTRVDAGALAAAVAYQTSFNECVDPSKTALQRQNAQQTIIDAAREYAGYAQGDFNTRHDDVESGLKITVNDDVTAEGPCYDHPNDGGYWTQVDADASKVPSFFSGFGVPKPKIVASARLALVRPRGGMQPFVVANPTPPGTLDQNTIRRISAGTDCTPGTPANQLQTAFTNGCTGPFAVSTAVSCGASTSTNNAAATGPFDCVGGLPPGQLNTLEGTTYDNRWAPGGTCTPDNWPAITPGDPRLITVFLSDTVPANPNASDEYRITGYAAFYVRGWSGSPGGCSTSAPASGSGNVWGNVLTHYALPASRLPATTTPCTGGGILLCSAALVE